MVASTSTPSTVGGVATTRWSQRFVLDPNEALYGLGQHPGGVMNWVGHTVHLQQKNMDIAIPVLVSSKGYGVFWNNPAVTDVEDLARRMIQLPSSTGIPRSEGHRLLCFLRPRHRPGHRRYRDLTGAAPMIGRWG